MGKTDPKIEDKVRKLYDDGFSDEEIAERTGRNKATIGQWRKRRGLPLVFENRKRLTFWETHKIQEYLSFERKYRKIKKEKTLAKHEKGLIAFVMSLKHPLSKVSQTDIEDYIIANNSIDLTRRNELLRTDLATKFSIPNLSITSLYGFASTIIANRIFNRDGACTNCRSINPLHLYCSEGKFNLLDENLTTLCENCYNIKRH